MIILINVRSEADYSLQLEKNIQAESRKILDAEIDFLKSNHKKLAIKAISLVGDSRDGIISVINAFKIDMIVVGNRGMNPVKR